MITSEIIIKTVSDYFKQPIEKVLSTCRKQEYVKTRQASMYFIKLYIKGISLKMIGENFPGKSVYKDHATILFGIKKVKGYIDTDKEFKKDIDILDNKITGSCNLNSAGEHIETEAEKFERLWNERERILLSENMHLREEIVSLKNKVSELQGLVYGLKRKDRKSRKKKKPAIFKLSDIKPIVIESVIKEPAKRIEQPRNGRVNINPLAGSIYYEHAL